MVAKRLLLVIAALLSLTVLLTACKRTAIRSSTPAASDSTAAGHPRPHRAAPYRANVLTGEPRVPTTRGRHITALWSKQHRGGPLARPVKADILFEIRSKAASPAYACLYRLQDDRRGRPRPLGRDQFFRLVLPWQATNLRGGQSVCHAAVRPSTLITLKLNSNDSANGYRDYGRVNWAGKSYSNGTRWRWSARCTPTPTTSQTISAARMWI